jgi:hypothetical protein
MVRLDELIDFSVKHFPQYRREEIEETIKQHQEFNTFDYGSDNKGITYVVRYNVSKGGAIAHVLDLAIRPDIKSMKFIRYIIARNWTRWPTLRFLKFERQTKYPFREKRIYRIEAFIKKGATK